MDVSMSLVWGLGAARLGNAVLQKCARLLIFVEGTAEYLSEWGESFKARTKRSPHSSVGCGAPPLLGRSPVRQRLRPGLLGLAD